MRQPRAATHSALIRQRLSVESGHAVTQNALADLTCRLGWDPRSPQPHEPQYDLAWNAPGCIYVAEVKSITEANEERQLRLGLGQALRYRQVLSTGGNPTKAVLANERAPRDQTWVSLCRELDVILCWPPAFDGVSAGSSPPPAMNDSDKSWP
jgi:hypothetical protein